MKSRNGSRFANFIGRGLGGTGEAGQRAGEGCEMVRVADGLEEEDVGWAVRNSRGIQAWEALWVETIVAFELPVVLGIQESTDRTSFVWETAGCSIRPLLLRGRFQSRYRRAAPVDSIGASFPVNGPEILHSRDTSTLNGCESRFRDGALSARSSCECIQVDRGYRMAPWRAQY